MIPAAATTLPAIWPGDCTLQSRVPGGRGAALLVAAGLLAATALAEEAAFAGALERADATGGAPPVRTWSSPQARSPPAAAIPAIPPRTRRLLTCRAVTGGTAPPSNWPPAPSA